MTEKTPDLQARNSVNSKQFTANYVYSLQFTPSREEKIAGSKVYALRVSPTQYQFLKSLPNAPDILRGAIDALRIEDMKPEDKLLFLVNQIRGKEEEIERLEGNARYKSAKERLHSIPKYLERAASPEESEALYKEKAKEFADFDGEHSEILDELMSEGNYSFAKVREQNPFFIESESRVLATEKILTRKRQELADLVVEVKLLRESLHK